MLNGWKHASHKGHLWHHDHLIRHSEPLKRLQTDSKIRDQNAKQTLAQIQDRLQFPILTHIYSYCNCELTGKTGFSVPHEVTFIVKLIINHVVDYETKNTFLKETYFRYIELIINVTLRYWTDTKNILWHFIDPCV